MPRGTRLLPLLVVAAMLAAGAVTADGLLEPGRSERSGLVLRPAVADPPSGLGGDWYPINNPRVTHDASAVRVEPVVRGLQLISRPVPVVPGDCYRLELDLRPATGAQLQIRNETYTTVLFRTALEGDRGGARAVTFRAPSARLSIGLRSERRLPFRLAVTRVVRLSSCHAVELLPPEGD